MGSVWKMNVTRPWYWIFLKGNHKPVVLLNFYLLTLKDLMSKDRNTLTEHPSITNFCSIFFSFVAVMPSTLLFWTSGDSCLGFRSQVGFPTWHSLGTMNSSDSHLVPHLLASWRLMLQPKLFEGTWTHGTCQFCRRTGRTIRNRSQ